MRRGSVRQFTAFSLIELLVVIAVISILVAMLMPSLSRSKERARRAQCQSNLKQVGIALFLYADDYKQLLPDCSTNNPAYWGSWWPWDLHTNLVSELEARGAIQAVLYCPANSGMNNEQHWNFWKYDSLKHPIRILGYVFLLNGCKQVPEEMWHRSLIDMGGKPPSATELVLDVVGNQQGNYLELSGGLTDRSSHVTGPRPLGGNIAFGDGHIEWRKHSEMRPRIFADVVWEY
jgi:prepilin-type N-terminal cleavage/methylation domain-containing protein/prepilin-type processing-associated H-X9-DG protein